MKKNENNFFDDLQPPDYNDDATGPLRITTRTQ